MEQFEKLRERLNDALAKIDSAMEAVLDNKEDANLSSSLMSENLGLKSQLKAIESKLENLRNDNLAHIDMESLNTELAALRAEREKEKKELDLLQSYLPEVMNEDETEEIVKSTIDKLGISSMKEMGKAMGEIKKNHADTIDLSLVSQLIKKHLS